MTRFDVEIREAVSQTKLAEWIMSTTPREGEHVQVDGDFYEVESVYYRGGETALAPTTVLEVYPMSGGVE
jgi:hypothetical protein